MKNNRAVTLMELLVAIILLGLVGLGIASIEMFSRFQLVNSDRRAKLQNEASLVIAHMSRELSQVVGQTTTQTGGGVEPAVVAYTDQRGIRIRIDANGNGQVDAADIWVAYRHENSEIRFYPDVTALIPNPPPVGTGELLANHVVIAQGLVLTLNPGANYVGVTIRCRWYPALPASADNTEVAMDSQIKMPSVSSN